MNGDSYTDVDLAELVANHRRAKADASVVVVPADGRGDCGSVQLDGSGKLASFEEKQGPFHSPHANAGIYILSREMLYEIPTDVETSLERELLPEWLRRGKCIKAFIALAKCIDIGTPERYWRAQDILANVEVDANVSQCGEPIMRVMITGAAGFIGRYLAKRCLEMGCSVLGFGCSEPEDA